MPWHGQVHLNNILLRTLPNSRLVAAISDCYHLRAAWHAHRVIREASGSLYDYGYPKGLGGDHLYVTPELLRDGTWSGSQSEDVCTFGLSILHVSLSICSFPEDGYSTTTLARQSPGIGQFRFGKPSRLTSIRE